MNVSTVNNDITQPRSSPNPMTTCYRGPVEVTFLWLNNPADAVRVLNEEEHSCSSNVTDCARVTRAGRGHILPTPLHVFPLSFSLIIPSSYFHVFDCCWPLFSELKCTRPADQRFLMESFEKMVVLKMTYGEIPPK